MPDSRLSSRRAVSVITGLAVAATAFAVAPASPASAEVGGAGIVINEVYGGGGLAADGARPASAYAADFVELYNPTDEAVPLAGLSLQYRAAGYAAPGGGVQVLALDATKQLPAGDHYLVRLTQPTANGATLPEPDQTGSINLSASNGQVLLADGTTPVTAVGDVKDAAALLDMVGYGSTPTSFETAPTGTATSGTTSVERKPLGYGRPGLDTDANSTDFAAPAAPSPTRSVGDTTAPEPPPAQGEDVSIAQIQGTGPSTPLAGDVVRTEGVVTAAYPTGGLNGFVIQTGGTGGAPAGTPRGASDAVFVWGGTDGFDDYPAIGDSVEVIGTATEGGGPATGLTQLVPGADGSWADLDSALPAVQPTAIGSLPASEVAKEALESMLVTSNGTYTVTNVFGANSFAEIGLAAGTRPLIQPTEVADAQDTAAVAAVTADNAARRVAVDDGASLNYLTGRNRNQALPWLRPDNPIRVGARATVRQPMIFEFRNSTWKFQARTQLSAADTAATTTPVTFTDTRPANAAPRAVGGSLQLATFNVLNYFPTTGVDWIDRADAECTPFSDRQSNPVTVADCDPEGPRGAWNETNLERQQVKIVRGILGTGAEVLALQEIENSARLGLDRDAAVSRLVDELNAAAGTDAWAFVPSPPASDLPPVADQDVIRNALIYNSDAVRAVGTSASLGVDDRFVGSAREPMAQVFRPAERRSDVADFALVANHFKSKGSGVDDGTGQGNANPNRVAQAEGLSEFATQFAEDRGVEAVFLAGDFNSYTREDPMQVLYGDGYRKVPSDTPNEWSYSFSGLSGSLDHVLANEAASSMVTGSDYWGINGGESVAFEYSRANYNRTQFYDESVFRSSDHDPQVVGLTAPEDDPVVDLDLLSFNDFHGRINNSTTSDGVATGTAQFAGTVEQMRRNARGGSDNTLLLGNGDIYGASEFTSAINEDVPTFDVMNALRVAGSSVGNHEFDFGFDDLTGRVTGDDNETGQPLVDFPYLGANVYEEGTTDPVLPEYEIYEVDGVTVAAVGVVTQETPSLVSPTGIEGLEFGNAAEAADRVAAQLSDGDDANGEADVVVVLAHAGGAGFAEDATYADALAATTPDSEFQELAGLGDDVDAIFNGHTHQVYALRQPGVGKGGRAIVQAGQYGEHVGRVSLSYDRDTGEVTTRSTAVRDRVTTPTASLVEQFPAVAEVQRIVDRAIAAAAVVGNEPVGRISDDVTRARTATGGEDRGEESTLGGLIGNALRDGVALNGLEADLGVVNPGGIRADLVFAGNTAGNPANTDGVVTYAEANSVLPFTNNISLVQLTGAELRTVLEQQFQPAGSDRAYLHLGLSDNVQVTTDRTAPQGERITSVRIDGAPLDPAATYTVSTFSFLAAGGDNFVGFRDGEVRDTGLVDRDLWISYLRETSQGDGTQPIAPDQARRQVDETGLPESLSPGASATFTLSRLDMRSLDSPANTAVTARLVAGDSASDLGRVGTVANGTSEVTVVVPADAPSGSVVELVADPSGTTVTVPVEVDGETPVDPEPPVDAGPVDPELRASATPDPARRGETVRVSARVLAERDGERVPVPGRVVVTRANGDFVGVGQVDDRGRVRVRTSFERRGVVNLVLAFRSADRSQVRDGETTLRVVIRR